MNKILYNKHNIFAKILRFSPLIKKNHSQEYHIQIIAIQEGNLLKIQYQIIML